jgi:uncharacterized iron-regulated protein
MGCGPHKTASNVPFVSWQSAFDRDDPLVGKIWDPHAGRFVDPRLVYAALEAADFVLLGEQHDNPDHHRLQAQAIEVLVDAGRRPTIFLEMLEPDDDPRVLEYRASARGDAAGLGPFLNWSERGWPSWSNYLPIAEVAFKAGLPLKSANLPRSVVKRIAHEGVSAIDDELQKSLGVDQPFDHEKESSLEEELRSSHCGQLPEAMIGTMAIAQRARDGQMGLRMLAAGGSAVLIAGAGHVRTDRGVPLLLRAQRPNAKVVSLAFVEVDAQRTLPGDYASRFGAPTLPFDFAWFTPRASNEDPCAGFPHGDASRASKPP